MADTPIPPRPTTISPLSSISYLPTNAAYARWAATYDSDGNPLQAIDDLELTTLLPTFLSLLGPTLPPASTSSSSSTSSTPPLLIDLGCGTGRNTAKLLRTPSAHVVGLDASPEMLALARSRCAAELASLDPAHRASSMEFGEFDMIAPGAVQGLKKMLSSSPTAPAEPLGAGDPVWVGLAGTADALVSTLVVEHVPLRTYFAAVAALVRGGAYVLVTNMHADMGAKSQAGFNDKLTGEKVRPVSYAHEVQDVVSVAAENGLVVVEVDGEGVREREVTEELMARDKEEGGLKGSRAGKWVGTKIWFGIVFRKEV